MARKKINQEARQIFSLGPNFRIDVNNSADIGNEGMNVYAQYAHNKDNDVNLQAFTETGSFKLYNDRNIEIIAGTKKTSGNVDIVIAGMNGDVTITAMGNGAIRIKGKNIMIEAVEDLDLKAGRNITASSGSGRILLKGNKIDEVAQTGNAIENTFGVKAFSKSPVGALRITDVFVGNAAQIIGVG